MLLLTRTVVGCITLATAVVPVTLTADRRRAMTPAVDLPVGLMTDAGDLHLMIAGEAPHQMADEDHLLMTGADLQTIDVDPQMIDVGHPLKVAGDRLKESIAVDPPQKADEDPHLMDIVDHHQRVGEDHLRVG